MAMSHDQFWAAFDDAVLRSFLDGRTRNLHEVERGWDGVALDHLHTALQQNVDADRLERTMDGYRITPAGRNHLNQKAAA